mgnify:CR=1 FL=1
MTETRSFTQALYMLVQFLTMMFAKAKSNSHFFVQVLSRRLKLTKLKLAKSLTKLSFAPQTLSRQRLLTSLKKSLKQLTLKKLKLSLLVDVA